MSGGGDGVGWNGGRGGEWRCGGVGLGVESGVGVEWGGSGMGVGVGALVSCTTSVRCNCGSRLGGRFPVSVTAVVLVIVVLVVVVLVAVVVVVVGMWVRG